MISIPRLKKALSIFDDLENAFWENRPVLRNNLRQIRKYINHILQENEQLRRELKALKDGTGK